MLTEEKMKSILMPLQDMTLFLYPTRSNCRDLVLDSFKHVHNFSNKR